MAAAVAPTAVENLPTGHGEHAASDTAPRVPRNLPAGQSVQLAMPDEEPYLPAGQTWHADDEVDPAGENVPAGHIVHVDIDVAPVVAENCPAGQSAQSDSASPPTEA